jgi:hypothetical protein
LKTFGATPQLRELDWRNEEGHEKFIAEEELAVGQ